MILYLRLLDDTENGLVKTGRILQKQRRKDITNYNKNDRQVIIQVH